MAAVVRDVMMTFRGQNYLSSAIRNVGRDVGALSRTKSLSMAQQQNAVNLRRLATQKAILTSERQSLLNGSRYYTMQMRQAGLKDKEISANLGLRRQEAMRLGNLEEQAVVQTKLNQLQTIYARRAKTFGTPLPMVLPAGIKPESEAAFAAHFEQAVAGIPTSTKGLQRLKQLPTKYTALTQEQLEREFNRTALTLTRLDQRYAIVSDRMAQYDAAIKTQSLASQKFAAQTREEAAALRLKNEQIQTVDISIARQIELQNQLVMQQKALPTENWLKYSQAIEHTGRVMQMFGIIGTAAFAFMAKQAADLQSAATLAATQARPPGAPASATAGLSQQVIQGIYQQMAKFPTSATEDANAYYEVFSGTNIQNVQKATEDIKVFNEMAVAGGSNLKDMTQVGITLLNTFPSEFANMTKAADAFFSVVRYGRITADQLGGALGYIVPIAKSVGLNFEQVGQSLAFLTRQTGGRLIRVDAQGLARVIQLLGRADVSAGLAGKGIAVFSKQTGAMRNPIQIISDIHDRLKMTNAQLLNFFKNISAAGSGRSGTQGTIQAIKTFDNIYNSMKQALTVQREVRGDNNELTKSYDAMSKTAGVSLQVFINRLKLMGLIIGATVIPIFQKLSVPITWLAKAFNGLSPHVQHIIGLIAGIGAVATLVVGSLLMFIGIIGSMGARLRLMIGFMKEGQGLFGKLGFSALSAGEQMQILTSEITSMNEQLINFQQLMTEIRTGGPITQGLLTTGVPLSEEESLTIAERRSAAAKKGWATRRARAAAPPPTEGPSGERGSVRVGAALALGAVAVPAMLMLGSQVPAISKLEKHLGGINALLITTSIYMAKAFATPYIKRAAQQVMTFATTTGKAAFQSAANAAKAGLAWTISFGKAALSGKLFRTEAVVTAETVAVTNEEAAVATESAWATAWAVATLGLSLLIDAAILASGYIITHWDKVKHWMSSFWGWLKKVAAATWAGIKELGKAVAYALINYFTLAIRGILEVASHVPFVGHYARDALNAIDGLLNKLKPHIDNVTKAWDKEAEAQKRAAEASKKNAAAQKAAADAAKQHEKDVARAHHVAQRNRIEHAKAVIKTQPNVIAEITRLQALMRRAGQQTDESKILAMYTRYNEGVTKLEAGKTKAQVAAIRELLRTPMQSAAVMQRGPQQWIHMLIQAKKYMDEHPYDIAAAQKFENLQTQLNAAFKGQPALLAAINDVLGQYNTNLKNTTKNGKDAAVTMQQVQQNVQSLYDSFLQQEQSNMGQLFQGPWLQGPYMQAAQQFGFKPRAQDYMKDIKAQTFQFTRFHHMLDQLRKRGAPSALIAELAQMGPAANQQIAALTHMSRGSLRNYFGQFQKQQRLIHQATMHDLNSQLKDYLKYGRKVGLAMAAGIKQEAPAITKAIDRAIKRAFGNIPSGTSAPGGGPRNPPPQKVVHSGTVHHQHHGDKHDDTKARHARFRAKQRHNHPDLTSSRN